MSNGRLNRSAEKEAIWRRHLVVQSSGGLSVRSYCRLHGLSSPLFYAWRREIQKRDAEQAGPGRGATEPRGHTTFGLHGLQLCAAVVLL